MNFTAQSLLVLSNFRKLLINYSGKYKNYLKQKSNIPNYLVGLISKFAENKALKKRMNYFKLITDNDLSSLGKIAPRYNINFAWKIEYFEIGNNSKKPPLRSKKIQKKLLQKIAKLSIKRERNGKEAKIIVIKEKQLGKLDYLINEELKKINYSLDGPDNLEIINLEIIKKNAMSKFAKKCNLKRGDLIYSPGFRFGDRKKTYFIFDGENVIELSSEISTNSNIPFNILDVNDCYFPIDYWNKFPYDIFFNYDILPYIDQMLENISLFTEKDNIYDISTPITQITDKNNNKIQFGCSDSKLCKIDLFTNKVIMVISIDKFKNYLEKIKTVTKTKNKSKFIVTVGVEYDNVFNKGTLVIFLK